MAWSRAEDEVRSFIERTQIPFLRWPMGKGVMPDDDPLSVAATRTLALQNVFLMGARFNWIFHPGFRRGKLRPGAALCQGHEGHPARHRARGTGDRPGRNGVRSTMAGVASDDREIQLQQPNPTPDQSLALHPPALMH